MKFLTSLLLLVSLAVGQDTPQFVPKFVAETPQTVEASPVVETPLDLTPLGPVLQIRIMQQGKCPLGLPCQPKLIGTGSCVAVDHKVVSGVDTYALLTAAHVVCDKREVVSDAKVNWIAYPADHYYEVSVNGKWRAARRVFVAQRTDLALMTVSSSVPLQLACIAENRPVKDDNLRAVGFAEGLKLTTIKSLYLSGDNGPEELDSYHLADGPLVVGMSGGGVFNSDGDLVGILVGYPDLTDRIGLYTNQPAIVRFYKAAWP